jgi:serine/threonine-protein kinase
VPATAALLGEPSGLAVGLDGSLYIADSALLRVRRIDPAGTITTVAGTGAVCSGAPCGDGGPATRAALAAAHAVVVDPQGVVLVADGSAGVRRVDVDGTITTLAPSTTATGQFVAVIATPNGALYAATHTPDKIIEIDPATGKVTTVVGTGTSGYNGNTDDLGSLLPGTQVQVNLPPGLSVDLDGNVLFADRGNHLIRAYMPSSGQVVDDLAGTVVNGTPQGGFNGDGHWATETQPEGPMGVTATRGALLVVADSGNRRVRQVGPGPVNTALGGPPSPEVVGACRPGRLWSCQRLPVTPGTAAAAPHRRRHDQPAGSRVRHRPAALPHAWPPPVPRHRAAPLVPGRYQLTSEDAAGSRELTVRVR